MSFRKQNVCLIVSFWCRSVNLSWLKVLTPLIKCFFCSKFNQNEKSKLLKLSNNNTFVQMFETDQFWNTITIDDPLYINKMKGEVIYRFRLKIDPLLCN